MKIAFWTAYALARPLHALQRWWQGSSVSPRQSISMGAERPRAVDGTDMGAISSTTTQSIHVERVIPAPISYRPAALVPMHFFSPCRLGAPTSSQKIPRAGNRSTATRLHGTQRPLRILHGSASIQEAGHFCIAGRVADVYAELERLAAREAAH